jgi:3-methyladenine DNA glycosylase AlkD
MERLAESKASKARLKWFQQQHKGSELVFHGISISDVRKLIKKFKDRFEQLSLQNQLDLAGMFYRSGVFEQTTIGDSILELSSEKMTPNHFDLLDEAVSNFSNWASVDWLCLHVLQSFLLKYRDETLKLLSKWNRSENRWKRRASVVAFVWKIGSTGEFTNEVLELCDNLIWDKEDLVKKGVGWALRDNMHGAKERIIEYVKSLRQKGVSSIITLYAIGDLKGKEREDVLKVKA